jgi:hypothetical protein
MIGSRIMIRTIAGLALAGIALTPYAEKAKLPVPAHQSDVDTINTSSMKSANQLVYDAAAPSGAHCRIIVNTGQAGKPFAHPEADCAEVYPGLETVSVWSQQVDDIVRLGDQSGMTVLELGASDGFAYEAVSPAAARITISEINRS